MKKWILAGFGAVVVIILIIWSQFISYPHLDENEIKDFPLYAQPDGISCGPTCCQMVLDKYGTKVDLANIKKEAKTEVYVGEIAGKEVEIGGTIPDYLQTTMKHFGVPVSVERGTLDQLKYYVDQKRPPICLVRSGKNMWHYVVFIGYTKDKVIIADPGGGEKYSMEEDTFINCWSFESDMYGREMVGDCKICKGDGKIGLLPGPFGKCDACGGTGKETDFWLQLYLMAGYPNYTMIVPKKPFED